MGENALSQTSLSAVDKTMGSLVVDMDKPEHRLIRSPKRLNNQMPNLAHTKR
jgi:hypothetical protein